MPSSPLTVAELGAALTIIGGFEASPRIAVAVSGGPDSMALTLLADRWARRAGGQVWALTVDHQLRPESAAEAQSVAGWLGSCGIPHAILVWRGGKPASGIQEAARSARYELLADWCRRNGVLHLLTAHHREDQAETYLIRRRARSGNDGLAGISAVRMLPGVRLLRPLLAVPKVRLQAFLDAERQPFLCDPSNRNPVFARARLRLSARAGQAGVGNDEPASACLAASSMRVDEIIENTRVFAGARIAREGDLDRLIGRAVSLHPAGFAAIDPATLAMADAELAERLLARVVACIGVARYPARRERVGRLHKGLATKLDRARTLGGCRIVPWRDQILVVRELAAASPSVSVEPGCQVLWDNRFFVALAADATQGFRIGYLGARAAPVPEYSNLLLAGLPRLIYPTLPAFLDADGLAAVPHAEYRRPSVAVLPSLSFRPSNPLTRVGFTVV